MIDEETAEAAKALVARGFLGPTVFWTDDSRSRYAGLSERG